MAAAGWDGERGRRLPSAAQLPPPGWKPARLPFSSLALLFQQNKPSERELYFKGRNREERWMKDVVDFEWKANGLVFHLKLILSLSTILIVNRWKLLFFWSECKKKKKERKKKKKSRFPFLVYFLILQSCVALKTIARSSCLFALNVYGYFRCQISKCFVCVCNTILYFLFHVRNLKWLYHFIIRNVKRGQWVGGSVIFIARCSLYLANI